MKKYVIPGIIAAAYTAFALMSHACGIRGGQRSVASLANFAKQMTLLLPFAFALIGLFEVWISRKTVVKYLGRKTGFPAYLLAVALAGTTVGGMYVAFPFAYSLYKKGAKLTVIFTYLTCSGICRIPMAVFEASFLGLKFTIIRFSISVPLAILSSWLLGHMLQARGYTLNEPDVPHTGKEKQT